MKGGTAFERLVAYYGIGLLALNSLLFFSAAFDSRFGFGSPLWLGGFLPLLAIIPTVRQLRAWNEGTRASRLVDPFRARFELRALPTLAWLAAGGLSVIGVYILLLVSNTLSFSDSVNLPFLLTILAAFGVEIGLSRQSDRRDRRAKEAAGEELVPPTAPGRKDMVAAQELPASVHRTAKALFWLTFGGWIVGLVILVMPQTVPIVFFYATLAPAFAWIGYSLLVIRPRIRRIEREKASRSKEPSSP